MREVHPFMWMLHEIIFSYMKYFFLVRGISGAFNIFYDVTNCVKYYIFFERPSSGLDIHVISASACIDALTKCAQFTHHTSLIQGAGDFVKSWEVVSSFHKLYC